VNASKQEIGARVDALAQANRGDEFVTAIEQLAQDVGPEGRPLLQEVLLERAADEEDFKQALRRRFDEKGWTRRTLARFEGLWRDDRADGVAEAVVAGPAGREALARELESLRESPGRAAVVLDELSRHRDARVRAWVPGAAADLLGDGAGRLILSLTRDRDPAVRTAAVSALVALGPAASRLVLPDLRRRLHSSDANERVAAIRWLAEAGDDSALPVLEERAFTAELLEERQAADAAVAALRERGA
jgi:HEAT repeat protein